MSEEFKEHVKEVLTPLETTLVDSAARLEEHLKTSMDQHEKFVKNAHDCLVEASGKFKDALTKQVRGIYGATHRQARGNERER
jgi:hypothetical protein